MKLRKILGFLIILIALFGFTGCDDILEIWFEDELEGYIGGDGGDNGIGVWVEIVIPPGDTAIDPQIAARVEELRDFNSSEYTETFAYQNVIWPNWDWTENGDLILSGYIELYGIPSGTAEVPAEYRVMVWLERTTGENPSNGYPDFDEPMMDAEYFDASGNPDTVFRFPSNLGKWVEAEAHLEFFTGGAEPRNFNFKVNGTFVIDPFDLASTVRQFDVRPGDPELLDQMEYIDWTIVDRWTWGWQASGTVASNEFGFPTFDVDLGALPEGDYWIEFDVSFADGWAYRKLPLRVGNEANATVFDLHFSIWGATNPPLNFNGSESYTMWYEMFNEAGPTGYANSMEISPDDWGDFELDFGGILYSPSTSINGLDWMRITIDHNNNDVIDDGDWRIAAPVVLMQFETETDPFTHIWFDAEDMRPVFISVE